MLTLLHSKRPKLYTILAFLSAIGLSEIELHVSLSLFNNISFVLCIAYFQLVSGAG